MLYLTETLELGQILLFTQICPNCRISINICKNKTICHKLLERYFFLLCSRYKVLVCFQLKEKTIQLFAYRYSKSRGSKKCDKQTERVHGLEKGFSSSKVRRRKILKNEGIWWDKIRKDEKHSL